MLLVICTTQVKKRVKKKKKKNNVTIILLQEDSNPHPPNTLELKMNSAIDWATPVSVDNGCLKPQICYFNLMMKSCHSNKNPNSAMVT